VAYKDNLTALFSTATRCASFGFKETLAFRAPRSVYDSVRTRLTINDKMIEARSRERGRQWPAYAADTTCESVMKHEKFLADTRRVICAFGALVLIAGASAALGQTGVISPDEPAHKASATPAASPHSSMDKIHPKTPGTAAGKDMRDSMMGMMKSMDAMKMTGDTDRDFAMMMKVHHQGAIDMAQFELEHGTDPKMRAMAKQIIKAQQKEIAEIDRWLGKRK